uniref:Uncharacterized protein n=1 Tax=Oryzias melastigma TaxID=30732 RepID=A0A3B3CF49_ORYME
MGNKMKNPGVYIGTVADLNDSQALSAASVSHILSVDSVDPGPHDKTAAMKLIKQYISKAVFHGDCFHILFLISSEK